MARIAVLAGMDRRNVPRSIRVLEKAGLLRRERRKHGVGGWDHTMYVMVFTDEVSSLVMTGGVIPGDERVSSLVMKGCHPGRCTEQPIRTTHKNTHARQASRECAVDEESAKPFESFWHTYPSRRPHSNPKKPARQKFDAAVKRGIDPAVIIRGAENYRAAFERNGTETRYIPHAVTWLRQEQWNDYQQPPEPPRLQVGMI